jgi:D-alanyl-D-alanine carboxypeptidase
MRRVRAALTALLMSLAAAGPGAALEPSPAAPLGDDELVAALKAHLQTLSDAGEFSGAVLLARGDRVLMREAYGPASRETGTPNTPETRFNLGSIDKAFTRLAIEQLARAGKLGLSDTLERYVPEYPVEKGRRINIEQLLDHRGGTGDFFGPKYEQYDRSGLKRLRDWLPLIVEGPLQFEPGTQQRYSNAGYLLLGLVIEKVTGRPYFDYVREQIFAPAGMKDTGSYSIAEGGERLAIGYTREGGSFTANRRFLPWRGSSAGGGYSTVDDLMRFASAMRDGRFGVRPGGLGVAGGSPGVNAVLEMFGDHTLVVLANMDPPTAEAVAAKVREWNGIKTDDEGAPGAGRRIIRAPHREERPGRPSLPARW